MPPALNTLLRPFSWPRQGLIDSGFEVAYGKWFLDDCFALKQITHLRIVGVTGNKEDFQRRPLDPCLGYRFQTRHPWHRKIHHQKIGGGSAFELRQYRLTAFGFDYGIAEVVQ